MSDAIRRRWVTVGEGVRLHVLEAGDSGAPALVMLPGWSQTAEQYRAQLEGLADRYRVLGIDQRGHGESDKPAHGYSIQRLAADLEAALDQLGVQDATALGHSMGCSVLWCHFDLYGSGRFRKYVFCDQMAAIAIDPAWSEQERQDFGGILTPEAVSATCQALVGPAWAETTEAFLRTMVSPGIAADAFARIMALNLKLPRAHAARLLYNHCHQDWRDVLPRLDKPCLFIGGEISNVPVSAMRWNAAQVQGARLDICPAAEQGSHFMFIENPDRFNDLLRSFA